MFIAGWHRKGSEQRNKIAWVSDFCALRCDENIVSNSLNCLQ